jgi:hypothetical protein
MASYSANYSVRQVALDCVPRYLDSHVYPPANTPMRTSYLILAQMQPFSRL